MPNYVIDRADFVTTIFLKKDPTRTVSVFSSFFSDPGIMARKRDYDKNDASHCEYIFIICISQI